MASSSSSSCSSSSSPPKPHAVLIPQPAQGHITPMLQLAKVLHSKGFHITFVNSEYNHKRFLKSRGSNSLQGFHDFHFEAIPDGLPPSDDHQDVTQDIAQLCISTTKHSLAPFRDLLLKLNSNHDAPPVTCVVADGVMSFAQRVAQNLGILSLVFWTTSACGFMGYLHFAELISKGFTPLKDESYLSNGYLETSIGWIPGMKDMRLKDFPSFIRTTNRDDIMLNFDGGEAQNAYKAWGVIINTYYELEKDVIDAMKLMFPHLYTIGPLFRFASQIDDEKMKSIGSNLWKEDTTCIDWLDKQKVGSVVYVNFGSITVMTKEQLGEFAWGLANSKHPFLWVIRPDLVAGEKAMLPEGFIEETKGRGVMASWCPQEQVLSHPSLGVFLTHSGWNSTLESICNGVPMICWPFFAEQPTNCRYVCREWGVGIEIDGNVRRDEVEELVREMMEGEKGKEMRLKVKEWKEKSEDTVKYGGSSYESINKLVNDLMIN
ncbi:7-deoxyloganetin glucosyltransferase-like isoform X1 [Dioscorea cayenensis subsp. rotundata]|uniref:Glycosyltransferase n=1 Tax=Dioscorea cayennensis subsp. rotundata TaxID=55577 RepID=A0AB40BF58_DIOCR|nr:7-deoxyloganetin glucosyltransferase-like isoform X1 [Dioscorea cayenensis subsp. rotundata]